MKSKEHTKEVRDNVVEKFQAGLGYKKISKALNISRSTVQSIIQKWKENGTTATLPRRGRPSKLTSQTRRALIRDAVKTPMITLGELQKSAAQAGVLVHKTTISRALHKYGIREEGRKSSCQSSKKKSKTIKQKQPDLANGELTEEVPAQKKKYQELEEESEKEKNVDHSSPYQPTTRMDIWQQVVGDYLARSSDLKDSSEAISEDDNCEDDAGQKGWSTNSSCDNGNTDVNDNCSKEDEFFVQSH